MQAWDVHDETKNEWQVIAGFRDAPKYNVHILAVDGELYVLGIKSVFIGIILKAIRSGHEKNVITPKRINGRRKLK